MGPSRVQPELEQEVSGPDRVSGLDRARTHQGRVENEQKGGGGPRGSGSVSQVPGRPRADIEQV